MESKKRTLLRTISFRILAILITIPFVFIYTNDWLSSITDSLILHVILVIAHYIHDRVWLKIKWE